MNQSQEELHALEVVEHEFESTRFFSQLSTHHEKLECAAVLWRLVLDRARQDLRSEQPGIRADAYWWLVSPLSDLYTDLCPRFGLDLTPSSFREDILAAGLSADFPDHGVPRLLIDTDNQHSWAHSPVGESQQGYLSRLADLLINVHGEAIQACVLNGVAVDFHGTKAFCARQAVNTFLICLEGSVRLKTMRRAILNQGALQASPAQA